MAIGAKIGMKVISIAIGIPVGIATRKAVERAWALARPDQPPRKPTDPGVQWTDAVAWAALSGVGIVLADLLTRRGSEVAYQAITGSPAPEPKPGKDAKKLQKAQEKAKVTDD